MFSAISSSDRMLGSGVFRSPGMSTLESAAASGRTNNEISSALVLFDGCALAGLHSLRSSPDGCALAGLHSLRSSPDGCALAGLHSLRSSPDGCALPGLHSLRSSPDGCALPGLHSLRSLKQSFDWHAHDAVIGSDEKPVRRSRERCDVQGRKPVG